ncbi:PilZ domain-containing protein [Marinobacter lacisalsi]|uniref:PilZ domain-containing protein n=1 Tax=Marinobacter lacisalsi TaxID=475979 RepID=A0ABV8QNK8_9GAMM
MNSKDPYTFGSDELEPDQDQRDEFRLVGRASVTLELESAEPGEAGQPRVAVAASSDVSPGGLRVVTAEPLTPDALLPASIQLHGAGQTFPLTVEVIWCRVTDEGDWQSGLKILDTGDSDYLAWMDAVARAMEGQ